MHAVHIRSDRHFHFATSAAAFWTTVESVDDYQAWWPWLRAFEAHGLVEGDTWLCRVQPPLPYGLQFTISLDEVVPARLIRATVSGDLRGEARLEIRDVEGKGEAPACVVTVQSTLSPVASLPRAVATLAPRIARFGHDWVIDNGMRQFQRTALRTDASS